MFTVVGSQLLSCHRPPCSSEKSTFTDRFSAKEFCLEAPISMPCSFSRYFVASGEGGDCLHGAVAVSGFALAGSGVAVTGSARDGVSSRQVLPGKQPQYDQERPGENGRRGFQHVGWITGD